MWWRCIDILTTYSCSWCKVKMKPFARNNAQCVAHLSIRMTLLVSVCSPPSECNENNDEIGPHTIFGCRQIIHSTWPKPSEYYFCVWVLFFFLCDSNHQILLTSHFVSTPIQRTIDYLIFIYGHQKNVEFKCHEINHKNLLCLSDQKIQLCIVRESGARYEIQIIIINTKWEYQSNWIKLKQCALSIYQFNSNDIQI